MGNKNDNIFDESLRRKLSGAGEMPPERVWDGIASALDPAPVGKGKPSRGKVLLLSGLGFASVAAAIAAFFLLRTPAVENIAGEDMIAEVVETVEPVEPETAVAEVVVPEIAEAVNQETAVAEVVAPEIAEAVNPETAVAEALKESVDTMEMTTVETDEPETELAEAFLDENESTTIDNESTTIDIIRNGEKRLAADAGESVYELCIGGNSFVGPGKKTEQIRMMSQGRFKIPTSTSVVENNDTDYYYLPMSFGVGIKFRILKWMDVGIGVNYTLLSKRVSGRYYEYDSAGNLTRYCSTELKNSQHYIGVPLDIYFNIFGNEKWNTYASIGGCLEKCVLNHYSGTYDDIAISHNTLVEGIQTSVKAGLGVEYSPVRFLGIYLDPSLRYYFDNKQPRSIRTSQPLSFGVEAGIRFKL